MSMNLEHFVYLMGAGCAYFVGRSIGRYVLTFLFKRNKGGRL